MNGEASLEPRAVIERLQAAQNRHDLEAFVACMRPDYYSEQPAHPDRTFRGREQVRKNWGSVFSEIPDFHADVISMAVAGNVVWTEWHWYGTQTDGGKFDWRGVTLFGIEAGQIAWGRLYMGPVEAGAGIDAAVKDMTHGSGE